jgi:hypothetical protein
MFDPERAIAEWRSRMVAGGMDEGDALKELECHLRDDLEHQIRAGQNPEAAFHSAVQNLGQTDLLREEFAKVERQSPFKRAWLTLAGIPHPQLATPMNTTSPVLEPRWATYVKAGAFVLPALLLWTVAMIWIFPKLQQISRDAGARIPDFFQMLFFFRQYDVLAGVTILLTLALLEWRSPRWPQYRRAALGVTVFLLNATVMISLTLMIILAILVAPALAQLQINR